MTSTVRKLFNQGYGFKEVVESVGGLDRYIKDIENDEDYAMLASEEKQMLAEIQFALQNVLQKGDDLEEEAEPDEDAYY